MPLNIYKKLYPRITHEQLVATKKESILLKYITQQQQLN